MDVYVCVCINMCTYIIINVFNFSPFFQNVSGFEDVLDMNELLRVPLLEMLLSENNNNS